MSAFAEGLAGALGDPPAPARVRRIGAVWPAVDAEWASDFVKELVHRDPTGAAALAFQDALTNADVRSYSLEALAKLTATNGEAWALPAFAKELTHPYHEVRSKAAWAMKRLQENRVDLTAFVPVLIASLDEEDAPNTSMLVALGAPAVKPLLDALRTSKAKWRVIGVLGQIGDKSAADEVERILRTSADGAEVRAAAEALVALRGNDAKDALAAALVNNGGANAHGVLRSCENSEQFSVQARVELVKIAFAKTPGRVYPDEDGAAEGLPADATREVALLALKSPSSEDRAWGAEQEQHLLDIDAWDALLAAAQDHDVRVRDAARDALRAIRAKESEMAEFRAMGEERATRLRIESLLRPKDGEGRSERVVRVRAGVAAIAATNLAGMVNDLIRLAAEDEDESVREDARKALLAMAKPAVPAPQPPAEKK
jgi:HEAT repeat protein